MDHQTKAKIAQCLSLSMEIKGYTFANNPNCEMCEVYRIANGEYTEGKIAWYHEGSIDTLDNLIDWLNERIANHA